ncbi:MAG: T9SS type A sorting domain-containing protein [Bacteroidales bacterium]|nr:T9SS type A sorting domain-containing protein [Bacteroidales bacterium]
MKKSILVFLIFSLMITASFAQITAEFSYEPEICGTQISVTDVSSGEMVITRAWYKDDVLLSIDGPETYNFSIDAINVADTIMVSLVVEGATSSDSVAHQVICYEQPMAYAGTDTLFCGYFGNLNAVLSVDNENSSGNWFSESSNINFEEIDNPESLVTCSILIIGDTDFDNIELIWTEDNYGCTSSDTVVVGFARIPRANLTIIPPRCNGEPASIKAQEDSLQNYDWDFGANCQIDSIWPLNEQGGDYRYLVHWEDEDTAHFVSLTIENYWGCTSFTRQDTVFDSPLPSYDVEIAPDTCLLDKGAVTFIPASYTYTFQWIDTSGLNIIDPYSNEQTSLPAGTYDVSVNYPSPNHAWATQYINLFGSEFCLDTFDVTIDNVGFLNSGFTVSDSIVYLSNPEVNFTYSGDANDNVLWNFGDGNTSDMLNPTHTYQDTGVFTVSLYAYNSDNCGDISVKTIDVIFENSINTNQLDDIMVYPNPSGGRITLKSEHEPIKHIDIFDVMGNKTDEIIPENNQFSVDFTLKGAKGIYLIKLTTEEDIYYRKVVLR